MDEPLIPQEASPQAPEPHRSSKPVLILLTVILLLIIGGIIWYILSVKQVTPVEQLDSEISPEATLETATASPTPLSSPSPEVEIQSEVELQSSLNELDQADFTQFETTLKENDSDASEL